MASHLHFIFCVFIWSITHWDTEAVVAVLFSHPSFVVLSAIIQCSQYSWTPKLSGKTSFKLQTLTQHWTVKVNIFFLTFRLPSPPLLSVFQSLCLFSYLKSRQFYCVALPFINLIRVRLCTQSPQVSLETAQSRDSDVEEESEKEKQSDGVGKTQRGRESKFREATGGKK